MASVNPADRPSPLLEVRQLRRSFGGLVAVGGIDFDLLEGEILGLVGPNGSGKTTVIHLLTGELKTHAGEINFCGQSLIGLKPHEICRRRIGRTFQLVRVMQQMTALDNVLIGRLYGSSPVSMTRSRAEALELLALVGLADRASMPAGALTYVDQKGLELARALATQPQVLLLDEWLAGLNPAELDDGIHLLQRVQESGVSIIMVEHVIHAIRSLCDRVIVMNAGRIIAEGTPDAALAAPDVVRAYLGDHHAP